MRAQPPTAGTNRSAFLAGGRQPSGRSRCLTRPREPRGGLPRLRRPSTAVLSAVEGGLHTTRTADDFYTAHHELGPSDILSVLSGQPYLFSSKAPITGFNEHRTSLHLTRDAGRPEAAGLLDRSPGPRRTIPYPAAMGSRHNIAILPFANRRHKCLLWRVLCGEKSPHAGEITRMPWCTWSPRFRRDAAVRGRPMGRSIRPARIYTYRRQTHPMPLLPS